MAELYVHVWGDGIDLRFDNCREDRTLVADRVVKVAGTTFVRKGDRLYIMGMSHSVHRGIRSRGALRYVAAAWRLGALKKSVYVKYEKMLERKQAAEHLEQAAANARDYLKQTGIPVPADLAKALEKMAR